jgi:hypothetical protein
MKAQGFFSIVVCFLSALCVVACIPFNPCRGLSKGQGGPSKKQYLPCASAMLDSLGKVDAGLVKLANGDKAGRGEAMDAMADFERDIDLVGGSAKLRQKWSDRDLNEINGHICNAYQVYKIETIGLAVEAFYRLDKSDVSLHNVGAARSEADQARNAYRSAQ